jgi:hypothetical protein
MAVQEINVVAFRRKLAQMVDIGITEKRLMKVDRPGSMPPQNRASVLVIDYDDQISQLHRAIKIEADGIEPCECGIGVNGESHDEGCDVDCPNAAYNDLDSPYCTAAAALKDVGRQTQRAVEYAMPQPNRTVFDTT